MQSTATNMNVQNSSPVNNPSPNKKLFIQMVLKRPLLWDTKNYKKSEMEKARIWLEIGKELNLAPGQPEKVFKTLREHYRKELFKMNEKLQSGEKCEPTWEFFGAMGFLRPFIKLRKPNSDPTTTKRNELSISVQPGQAPPKVPNQLSKQGHTVTIEKISPGKKNKVVMLSPNGKVYPQTVIGSTPTKQNLSFDGGFPPQPPSLKRKPDTSFVSRGQNQHLNGNKGHANIALEQVPSMLPILASPQKEMIITNGNGCHTSPAKKMRLDEEQHFNSPNTSNNTLEEQVTMSMNERALFHSSFGTVVAAKLNTLDDVEANQLMNELFMTLLRH